MMAEIEEAELLHNVEDVEFIDTVNESAWTQQPPAQMRMRSVEHVDYSFTNEENKYLIPQKRVKTTQVYV